MELHRSTGRPDWQDVTPAERNAWQRLAAATAGLATPGNFVTVLGFAAVIGGLIAITKAHYWFGLGAMLFGRLCDVADGWLASRTDTKSPTGEFLDVLADKLTVLGVVIAFWIAHLIPGWLILAMAAPHVIISILTVAAALRHRPLHPSRYGKYNMAAVWVIVPAFVAAYAIHMANGWLMTFLEVLAILNVVTGLCVASGYAVGKD